MEKMSMPKLSKFDIAAVAALVIFVILVSIPVYTDKQGCEVARPAYKCASAKEVIIENCNYWGKWNCDTNADNSLPQVEWYIKNLCDIHNKYHPDKFDCGNLRAVCSQATGENVCSGL